MIDSQVVEALVWGRARVRASPPKDLMPRDLDVLREMAQGRGNAGIAAHLHLSESSVEKHVNVIFTKLGPTTEDLSHRRVTAPVSLGNAAAAIFAVLGLIDVALTGVIGSSDAPSLIVSLGVAALGLITLLSLVPARRSSRGALIAIVVTRVISAALAVPAFFLNASAWAMIVEGFVIVATITGLVLVQCQELKGSLPARWASVLPGPEVCRDRHRRRPAGRAPGRACYEPRGDRRALSPARFTPYARTGYPVIPGAESAGGTREQNLRFRMTARA